MPWVTVAATARVMSGSGRRVPRPTESKVHALSKPAASMLRAASERLAAPKGGPPAGAIDLGRRRRPEGRDIDSPSPRRLHEEGMVAVSRLVDVRRVRGIL